MIVSNGKQYAKSADIAIVIYMAGGHFCGFGKKLHDYLQYWIDCGAEEMFIALQSSPNLCVSEWEDISDETDEQCIGKMTTINDFDCEAPDMGDDRHSIASNVIREIRKLDPLHKTMITVALPRTIQPKEIEGMEEYLYAIQCLDAEQGFCCCCRAQTDGDCSASDCRHEDCIYAAMKSVRIQQRIQEFRSKRTFNKTEQGHMDALVQDFNRKAAADYERVITHLFDEAKQHGAKSYTDIYSAANIGKTAFESLLDFRKNVKRETMLSVGIALQLPMGNFQELMQLKGYALSPEYLLVDAIVSYYIHNKYPCADGEYPVDVINAALLTYTERTLNARRKI